MEPRPGLQKVRFCYYLLHLSWVQRLKKGPHFGIILGICFLKKTKKGGSRKDLKISPQKTLKMGSKQGGVNFTLLGLFLTSEPCSDPLCCWNAPGPLFFTILASLFLHFCVAARYKEQLFSKKKRGLQKITKNHFKKNSKNAPNTGGEALMKHFPSAVHWETREAALPRRRRLGYLARHGSTRSWHGTARNILGNICKKHDNLQFSGP